MAARVDGCDVFFFSFRNLDRIFLEANEADSDITKSSHCKCVIVAQRVCIASPMSNRLMDK